MTAEELALEAYPNEYLVSSTKRIDIALALREGFIKGFEACQATFSNKYVLTVDDIKTIVHTAYRQGSVESSNYPETLDKILEEFNKKQPCK